MSLCLLLPDHSGRRRLPVLHGERIESGKLKIFHWKVKSLRRDLDKGGLKPLPHFRQSRDNAHRTVLLRNHHGSRGIRSIRITAAAPVENCDANPFPYFSDLFFVFLVFLKIIGLLYMDLS